MATSINAKGAPTTQHVWGAVLSMSLCAFALVASEFMPVSLLTPIAQGLSLTEGQAGQAISVSGLFAVLSSLLTARLSGRLDRKTLLLGMTALMMLSGVLVALAPNYPTLMLGRALLGVAIGGNWSMSTAVMIRVAPEALVPRAIGLVQGGSALATAVAAPLGSFLGGLVGWRGAFFCVVPLAAVALIWQASTLPRMPVASTVSGMGALKLLGERSMRIGLMAVGALFMGQFALYTYLRPFLERVTGVDLAGLSLILLGLGTAGLLGTIVVGNLLARNLYAVLIGIPLIMSAIATGLVVWGAHPGATAALLMIWGLVATAAPVGWFTWLARSLPSDAEAGGGLMVAMIQLAITLGATVGGLIFDAAGYRSTFMASGLLLLFAAGSAYLTSRSTREIRRGMS